jgi:hypothetical protein
MPWQRCGRRWPDGRSHEHSDAVAAYVDGREERAAHGSREMPVWGDLLQVENAAGEPRIATLVAFIKGLQYR